MWLWLEKNNKSIQSLTAIITVLLTLGAIIGVKIQIDAGEKMQRAQSARDIYRESINLSIQNPKLALMDYCKLSKSEDIVAYESYVEYLLYTAEQVIQVDRDWEVTMEEALLEHTSYLCSKKDFTTYSPDVVSLIEKIRAESCASAKPCP
jgi:hypothetical protein